MELKVWCEGIPRVICGVTEKTTCRDVIIALAQAMGKIGQYTLVEKWRDKERFISPDESPLLSLSRWGEYANEVQLILRCSEHRQKANGHHINGSNNKLYGFSPHHSEPRLSSSSSLRKSLTFSGAHSHLHLTSTNQETDANHNENKCFVNGSTSVENIMEHDSETTQNSAAIGLRNAPYSRLGNGDRWWRPNRVPSQSTSSSLANQSDGNSDQRISQHGNVPFSYSPGLLLGGSLERTRRRNPPSRSHTHQSSDISAEHTVTSVHSAVSTVHNSVTSAYGAATSSHSTPLPLPSSNSSSSCLYPNTNTKQTSPVPDKLISLPRKIKPLPRESNNNIDLKPNANLTGHIPDLISDGSPSKYVCDNEEKRKLELLKLVSSQQEKIEKHENNIEKLDTDISQIEHFDHEPKENQKVIQELARLEKFYQELDNEIQELELVSWEGKLELELEKETRLLSEIETMRKGLNRSETELEKVNSKMKELYEEISKEKDLLNVEEKHEKEQEAKVLAEISKLQKQVEKKASECKTQQKSVDELGGEVKKKETEILEKKKKIVELEKELKDSNMKLFVRAPGELVRRSLEGRSLLSRVSLSRPSSARILENPDHLKEIVATSKNPHGLWV
ncbi:hypothetical protein LSH36_193g06023 [Paralvinella palmiformis]|uniref:Ras-associating domain-containing protein n=1 Tax=Paralvinella palmiformis TaxID=53620 RepID=A0AAD9JQZ8_9ANNE|nr:hypothetical protein LSH36_193g06023 [Paralvinella palmiformis]